MSPPTKILVAANVREDKVAGRWSWTPQHLTSQNMRDKGNLIGHSCPQDL